MAHEIPPDEEQRQCPICRMYISAWATKCRYCGEDVGRPKREEQKVTIKDLGGEQSTTYTISGNVKDALEAFRAEQEMAMEAQRRQEAERGRHWFQRKEAPRPDPAATPGGDSLSKMDARHRDLAQSLLADVYTPKPPPRRQGLLPEPIARALKIVGGVLGGLLAVAVVIMIVGRVAAWMGEEEPVAPNLMENEALVMLSRGEPLIEAFEESVRVANYNNTAEDRRIMEDLRRQLVEQINGLLEANPYDEANQRKAAGLVERAVVIDPSSVFRNLKAAVDTEGKAYAMVLKDFDVPTQQATFTLHNDGYRDDSGSIISQETAGINGLVQNRFVVQKINREEGVVLMDRQRDRRMVVFNRKGYDARAHRGS